MSGPAFLYLHGFASSPSSRKAIAFAEWGKSRGVVIERLDMRAPSLEHLRFSKMLERVTSAIGRAGGARARVVLIGSSLGGLTACRVAEADARVCALFLMAPALRLAERWQQSSEYERWQRDGKLEVRDHATGKNVFVDLGFITELAAFDTERGPSPDVRVPTHIVHGTADDVVDIEVSRTWAHGKNHVRLVEVADGHELAASVGRVLAEADDFFRPFFARGAV